MLDKIEKCDKSKCKGISNINIFSWKTMLRSVDLQFVANIITTSTVLHQVKFIRSLMQNLFAWVFY